MASISIIAAALDAQTRANEKTTLPYSIAYLTSWNLPPNAVSVLRNTTVNSYLIAFARWDDNGVIRSSNNVISIPEKTTSMISLAYQTWTETAYKKKNTQFLISFGGQEYENIWDKLGSEKQISKVAKNIAKLLNSKFPVYRETAEEQSSCRGGLCDEKQHIGYVQLDGVDFDFEQSGRLSIEQNHQMALLAIKLRALVGKQKLISLTTYHVGADSLNCRLSSAMRGCSFTEKNRSLHHGEVLEILKSTKGIFDFYNIMAYDAGRNFDYKTAMKNYLTAVGDPTKLRLGLTINHQWARHGSFVMTVESNKQRVRWQAKHGFGGFFMWAMGANSESRSVESQAAVFKQFSVTSKE